MLTRNLNQAPAFPPQQPGYPYPAAGVPPVPPVPGVPGVPPVPPYGAVPAYPVGAFPPGASPPPPATAPFPLPARPPSGAAGAPPYYYGAGAPPAGYPGTAPPVVPTPSSTAVGDSIDQLIRMAESNANQAAPAKNGTEEAAGAAAAGAGEKKKKGARMVYADTDVSPEEKMAMLPRYRWVEESAA
jgi:hypothetical protein